MNAGIFISRLKRLNLSSDRTLTLDSKAAIGGLLMAYFVALVLMILSRGLPSVFTVPFVVLALSFIPGALVVLALGRDDLVINAEHVLYAFGGSLLVLMIVGALVNILLPPLGVTKPLMPIPLGVAVTLTVGLLALAARIRSSTRTIVLSIPSLWSPTPLALVLLPLLSVIGVTIINATGNNILLVFVLFGVGTVPILAVWRLKHRWHSLAIWTMALAILYHKSLWQFAGFGGRPHGITAWEAGRWSPGIASLEPYSSELLQNGVLFPLYARLSDLFIMTQYEVVNPFFVSFIPLALYVAYRRFVGPELAFLAASVFIFVHPFYLQYPTAGRAATPVIFLALFGVAISNDGLDTISRALLAVSFLAGIVVTHYGTSYYVAAAFAVAVVILFGIRITDFIIDRRFHRVLPTSDGAQSAGEGRHQTSQIFTLTTFVFFIAASLGWYIYTRQGWKFELLPRHIYDNIMTLIGGPTVEGRTAARVVESYSSITIQISTLIYILLALLIAVGISVVYYRRFISGDRSFDDAYLAIATGLFGVFGVTLILSNWGGGRPMMISFSFSLVFAVVGVVWLVTIAERIRGLSRQVGPQTSKLTSEISERRPDNLLPGTQIFAVLMLVFLLLNSGVAAALVFDEFAPSNVPGQQNLVDNNDPESQVTVHRETDIVTHVWLVNHLDDNYNVYGDTFATRQFDWYRPDVTARTPAVGGGYNPATKPEVLNITAQQNGTQPGYLLIMGHNLKLDAVWPGKFAAKVTLKNISIDQRNRIYTTGDSYIYYYTESG